jgi:flavin-dependent dehydrogenase
VVVAREIEFLLPDDDASCAIERDRPELYFCADLRGYGWCFRKEGYLNVGLGRLDSTGLPAHLSSFLGFLQREERIGGLPEDRWRGHAYAIRQGPPRAIVDDGVVLVGDAAGLAASASGEGILPAVISGRLAAEAILASRTADYPRALEERLGPRGSTRRLPDRIAGALGAALLAIPGFARRFVLDRWFLHRSAELTRRGGAPTSYACRG